MSKFIQQGKDGVEQMVDAPIGRRSAMRRIAALSVAPAVAGSGVVGFAESALAATGVDPSLNARTARYALRGGKIVEGYFVSPRGRHNLGVVVVMPDQDRVDAKAQETARRYAKAGFLAVAPDLRATFNGGNRDAMVAEMMKTLPNLKRLAHAHSSASRISVVPA